MAFLKHLSCAALLALGAAAPALAQQAPTDVTRAEFPLEKSVLVDGLENPHALRIGPDGWLWVTERTGKRLTRIDPKDGTRQVAYEFDTPDVPEGAQSGVMGFAFHPDFGKGSDQVFVYHTYDDPNRTDPTRPDASDPFHRLFGKIERFDYDAASGKLTNPNDIITGIPANNDHNSGRLIFGPDQKLYLTVGDQGHNQLTNWCRPIEAQRLPTADELKGQDYFAYQGKVLRLNADGSIPEDNPEIEGLRSHIFSYGHRNPQGLDFGPDGTLYSNEHGPDSDDEINQIVAGGNYGWPHVAGQQDDLFYIYAQWSEASVPCETLTPVGPSQKTPAEVPQQKETDWKAPASFNPPKATMFTVTEPLPGCEDFGYFCRPSIGPSSIHYYGSDGVPEFKGKVLTTALKHGSIYAIDLSRGADADFTRYYLGQNRLRDLAISDDGKTIYVATDSKGKVQAEDEKEGSGLENPGAILVYTAK